MNGRFESAWTLKVDFEEEYPDVSVAGLPAPQRMGRQALYQFNHREQTTAELVQQLMARFQVVDLEVRRPPLEETIRRIYAEQLLTK